MKTGTSWRFEAQRVHKISGEWEAKYALQSDGSRATFNAYIKEQTGRDARWWHLRFLAAEMVGASNAIDEEVAVYILRQVPETLQQAVLSALRTEWRKANQIPLTLAKAKPHIRAIFTPPTAKHHRCTECARLQALLDASDRTSGGADLRSPDASIVATND